MSSCPVFSALKEIDFIRGHYMALNAAGHGYAGDAPSLMGDDDPLRASFHALSIRIALTSSR